MEVGSRLLLLKGADSGGVSGPGEIPPVPGPEVYGCCSSESPHPAGMGTLLSIGSLTAVHVPAHLNHTALNISSTDGSVLILLCGWWGLRSTSRLHGCDLTLPVLTVNWQQGGKRQNSRLISYWNFTFQRSNVTPHILGPFLQIGISFKRKNAEQPPCSCCQHLHCIMDVLTCWPSNEKECRIQSGVCAAGCAFLLKLNCLNASFYLHREDIISFLGDHSSYSMLLLHSCPQSSRFIAEEHRSHESYAELSENPWNPGDHERIVQRDDEGKICNTHQAWVNRGWLSSELKHRATSEQLHHYTPERFDHMVLAGPVGEYF